jgi:hypothetical protein
MKSKNLQIKPENHKNILIIYLSLSYVLKIYEKLNS